MAAKRTGVYLSYFLILLVSGCAAGVSDQARSQVTYGGPFADLQRDPDRFAGEVVLLGGKILETNASQTFSEISVLQLPLGQRERPEDLDKSEGRFLVRSSQLLDPAIYKRGTELTVVGRLIGREVRAIGGFAYAYPLVEAIEIKLWSEADKGFSRLHFGIGVWKSF